MAGWLWDSGLGSVNLSIPDHNQSIAKNIDNLDYKLNTDMRFNETVSDIIIHKPLNFFYIYLLIPFLIIILNIKYIYIKNKYNILILLILLIATIIPSHFIFFLPLILTISYVFTKTFRIYF
jgi:hypothetical protein